MSLIAARTAAAERPGASSSRDARAAPLPLLLLRWGAVPARQLAAILRDSRVELFDADALTPEWVSLSQRVAGTLVVTEGDPLGALAYAVTAGVRGPIVIAMSKRHRLDCGDLIAAGAAACITMPVTRNDIGRLLPILMKRASHARMDGTLRLLLDPISRIVRYRDQLVRLSQREFALLHCLSSRNGRPVSAEDLLTYVWGEGTAGRSRQILEVYICQVRKKLGELGLVDAISTVRGYGYVLAGGSPVALK